MLHLILQHLKVIRNLNFINISTMPLELRGGVVIKSDTILEYGAYIEAAAQSFHMSLELNDHQLHSTNQVLILDDIRLRNLV